MGGRFYLHGASRYLHEAANEISDFNIGSINADVGGAAGMAHSASDPR